MMPNFRMRAVNSAIELAVENNAAADSGSDCHVNQSGAIPSRAPTCFCESSGVPIVLERNLHAEHLRKILDRSLSPPSRQEVDIAKLSPQRIHRPGRAD